MESVLSMHLRKTCPKCGAVVQCMQRGRFVIVAMPLRVKGGHVAVMIVSLRKLPNAEGLHFIDTGIICVFLPIQGENESEPEGPSK